MLRRSVETPAIRPSPLIAVIAAFAVLVYIAVFFLPRRAVTAALAQQRDQLESEAAIQHATLAQLEEARVLAGSTSAPDVAALALPDTEAVAPLLAELTKRLHEVGMSVEHIKRRPDRAEDSYVSLSFAVGGRGTYLQITDFLTSLERMTRLVDVVALTLRAHPQRSEPTNVIDASCELRTYHLASQVSATGSSVSSDVGGENG